MKIFAARLATSGLLLHNQVMHIQGAYILSLETLASPPHHRQEKDWDVYFDETVTLIPGMIDLHIHGAAGADVMDATPEALETLSQTLLKEGVTGFLATTMTESPARIEAALFNLAQAQTHPPTGAEILGIHLEGPFLSSAYTGAQDDAWILPPDLSLLEKWHTLSGKQIKILTLAPEQPGADTLIHQAQTLGILPSIGHSAATAEQAQTAIDQGVHYATHLFNAMSGLHHRKPGAALPILLDDRVTAEIILDGHHLSPALLPLILKCKSLDRLVLITDAIRAKCLKNGKYIFGGQTVILEDQVVRLEKNGTLAGSVLSLPQALRHAQKWSGLPLEHLVPLVTAVPARLLKQAHQIGHLAPQQQANFVALDADFQVKAVCFQGRFHS